VTQSITMILMRQPSSKRRNDMNDAEFLAHIVIEICNYAVENQMEPDDTLKTVAENILSILTISTYNNWKGDKT